VGEGPWCPGSWCDWSSMSIVASAVDVPSQRLMMLHATSTRWLGVHTSSSGTIRTTRRMTLMPYLPCAMSLPCSEDGSQNCEGAKDNGTYEIGGNRGCASRGDEAGIDGEAGGLSHPMFGG
jgi:hypothetical protein